MSLARIGTEAQLTRRVPTAAVLIEIVAKDGRVLGIDDIVTQALLA